MVVFATLLWFFRAALGFLAPLTSYFPTLGDTELFARIISENYYPEEQSLGVKSYYYITYLFRTLLMGDIQSFVLFQNFIYMSSMLIIISAYRRWCTKKKFTFNNNFVFWFLLLSSLYPASLIYILVPLREFFLVFAMSIFLYGIVSFSNDNKIKYLLMGTGLIFLARPQLLPALACVIYLARFNSRWYHFLPMLFAPLICLFIFKLIFYDITPEKLSYIRANWSENHGEQVYGVFSWGSWFEVILDLPLLILQYMLSPWPILHNLSPFSMKAAFLDLLFTIPVYFSLLKSKLRFNNPFIVFSIVTMVMSAAWEAYIGGAVRHRIVSIIPLLPVLAYYLGDTFRVKMK